LPDDELAVCPAGAADKPFREASCMLLPPNGDTPPLWGGRPI